MTIQVDNDMLSVWEAMSAREAYWSQFDIIVEDDGENAYMFDGRTSEGEQPTRVAVMPLFLFNCVTAFFQRANSPTAAEVETVRFELGLS